MFRELTIQNFKSIVDVKIQLGRINVFIGANGSGKSNILEALAMMSAAKGNQLNPQTLFNKGVRVAKPNLTINSFTGLKSKGSIILSLTGDEDEKIESRLSCSEADNIFGDWIDQAEEDQLNRLTSIYEKIFTREALQSQVAEKLKKEAKTLSKKELDGIIRQQVDKFIKEERPLITKRIYQQEIVKQYTRLINYVIFNIQTNVLRGINSGENYTRPLGVSGEGLDILLSSFKEQDIQLLKQHKFIDWLKDFFIDSDNALKFEGHKIGRSKSLLYLQDKFMKRGNAILSAENTNEGALHAMFYLALMVSEITPGFFAIDNIENTLNPRLCENLVKAIAKISVIKNKQVLIATQSPAILDGLNLKDPEQRLFVVRRNLKGHTIVQRVEAKPTTDKKYKLSELFIEDYIGGLNPIM
ncbi:MAG: hypothetical protein JWO03_2801 [Bacteroidetes bacterium]|nr:hypothetical protein [Bacteroidota bacterium]